MHIKKRDVWKSLRAMLQTMRGRLPVDLHRSSRNCAERCGSSREPHWRRQNAEVMDAFPRDMEALLPALASAA
jgi:hypothetical protein